MHRILIVANETCPCPALLEEVRERATRHDPHRVHIVAPALNSRLRHYLSDVDDAVAAASDRLADALQFLEGAGVDAGGSVGDADPLVAVADCLHVFPADEVLVSTHPPGRSHWLERRLPERIEHDFGLPVIHLVSEYGAVST